MPVSASLRGCTPFVPPASPGKRYATGQFSDREIADILNAAGHKTRNGTLFTKDSVRSILKNPFCTGQITNCGEMCPGRQPPIISEELFEQVQAARRHRRRLNSHAFTNKPTYRIYLLNTRIHCAICGRKPQKKSLAREPL